MTITVAHVDAELMFRATLHAWLGVAARDVTLVASAPSVVELLDALGAPPAVVLLDTGLRNGTHLADNISDLREWGAHVVVTTSDTSTAALRVVAHQENAAAFLEKDLDPVDLVVAIRAAAAGRRLVPENWARFLGITPMHLTAKQREAIRWFCVGMTYAEGGNRMGIRATSSRNTSTGCGRSTGKRVARWTRGPS